MSEYEKIAASIMQANFYVSLAGVIITFCALCAAIVGGFLAFRNTKIIIWNSLLSFEQDMANRRTRFQEIAVKLSDATLSTGMLKHQFNEAKESYFNSLDRLASSILRGHFPDDEMRLDYREVFTEVVRNFQEDFGTGTRYRKIVKLYNRWQDQK
jgi:hypothetical protein